MCRLWHVSAPTSFKIFLPAELTPLQSQTQHPMANDKVAASRYGPTDNQKWVLSDGLLSPYNDVEMFVTGRVTFRPNVQ